MAADWPSAPTVGQLYALGTRTWAWNGTGWARVINAAQTTATFALVDRYVHDNAALPTPAPNTFVLLNYI